MIQLADFSSRDLDRIERSTREIGHEVFRRVERFTPTVFNRRWWDDHILSWAMQDESVKIQAFRFIDVLPMLAESDAVTRHLQEYFHDVGHHLPTVARLGLSAAAPRSIVGRAVAIAARRTALSHAHRFIAGANTAEVLATAMRERKLRRAFTLDILGEAVASEAEADRYQKLYMDLIDGISPTVNSWDEVAQIDRAELWPLPRVNVSVKLSALDSQFDPIDPGGTTERVARRLRPLLRRAKEHRAYVHVDMESYNAKTLTLDIFKHVFTEDEFRTTSDTGIVIQAYLRDSADDLAALARWARARGTPVWVRLVKGAYWDYETVHAQSMGWPVPVYQEKHDTDANFERLTRFLFLNRDVLRPAVASHNIRSLAHAIAVARHLGMPPSSFELQMLYGMGDEVKQAFVDMGYRMRIYMPYGELIPGMAYLVRRLLENTSNDSFLRASFSENVLPEKLLMNPLEKASTDGHAAAHRGPPAAAHAEHDGEPFRNEPPADFARADHRQAMADALDKVRGQLGRHYALVIDGQDENTNDSITSIDPSKKDRIVGTTASADVRAVVRAVAAAKAAWPEWARLSPRVRAEMIERLARRIRERRWEMAAWQVFECGKPWREADGDVCEAIDFCEYYARQAIELFEGSEVDVPGEENRMTFHPRGVAAVIAPWNFPLAILTGMTTAALVTGNTVVMKPAEQSSVIAAKLMEMAREVGLPPGVLNYLPGRGETAGAALVEHTDVSLIAFTGSREVGLSIYRAAAEKPATGAASIKRVIAELGGKNAIIVDDDADLDEAVLGVVKSAFGYQGQKCSACSRAIVLEAVYDVFVERLLAAAKSLKLGRAEDPAASVGPVIDAEALARINRYIAIGRDEARLAFAGDAGALADVGYFVAPHIFVDVWHEAVIAQEEIFGPVLAVIRAKDFDQALSIANNTDYALTGGVYSRSPAHLEQAAREFRVGNLYLNRPITGALVHRQPFGGFKMSGVGSKAGGSDYLHQFVVPRTITENTMRRGFAPTSAADAD